MARTGRGPALREPDTETDGPGFFLPDGSARAEQGGPRRLFDAYETAWDAWAAHGEIGRWDHGITITPEEQYVWEGDPDTGRRHVCAAPVHARG